MSVKTDASGNRLVQIDFEVPGTPEQVWHAIATGPGMSSWFVPTEVEEREGGALLFHLGPGMDSPGVVTGWEPPRRFAYEEPDWNPGAPPVATEILVEARSGGICVVRMVHSLFTSSEEWDDQLESFEQGWPPFLEILRLVMIHFPGENASSLRLMNTAEGTEPEVWAVLTEALGLSGATQGERRQAPASAPPLAGVVEGRGGGKHEYQLLLRLDEPAPGLALLGAYAWGGKTHAAISLYLFGDRAAAVAARDEPLWQSWMNERFPSMSAASSVAC